MKDETAKTSRRAFLRTALAISAGTAAATASSGRTPGTSASAAAGAEAARIERVLRRHGSEIGELRNIVGEA